MKLLCAAATQQQQQQKTARQTMFCFGLCSTMNAGDTVASKTVMLRLRCVACELFFLFFLFPFSRFCTETYTFRIAVRGYSQCHAEYVFRYFISNVKSYIVLTKRIENDTTLAEVVASLRYLFYFCLLLSGTCCHCGFVRTLATHQTVNMVTQHCAQHTTHSCQCK